MTTPVWESGKLYLPGDLVQPITAVAAASASITNAGFESGDIAWTKGTGWTIGQEPSFDAFGGTWSAQFVTGTNSYLQSDFIAAVAPGTSITASCMVQQGASSAGTVGAAVVLEWLDAASALVSRSEGNFVSSGSGGSWNQSTVTAVCPAGAEKVRIAARGNRTSQTDPLWVDNFTWSLVSQALPAGLIYKAVQADAGFSGSTEPAWPSTLGVTVVDNEVTWEAVSTSRVTWEASPILQSGTVEPDWPTIPGAFISDGTVSWECISRRVEDEKCPNTKVVAIMASKVFAADGDIVRFSATANPLDWSSANDAGYLPTGLQQANANDMAVLAPYRSNLAAFNASSFQNWQVDPDPAAMAQVDQMEGVGSTWTRAAQPVGNELFYLAARGVRTVGIAAGAANLAAGDVGMPIDPLVQDAARVALANGSKALATYYPSAGQYWLTFADYPAPAIGISGDVPDGNLNDAESYQYTVSGGVLPRAVTLLSGALPTGLSMDSAGLVTGTRTVGGVFSWVVQVEDADGSTATVADTSETIFDEFWDNVVSLWRPTGLAGSSTITDEKPVLWGSPSEDQKPLIADDAAAFDETALAFDVADIGDVTHTATVAGGTEVASPFGMQTGDFTYEGFVTLNATTGVQTVVQLNTISPSLAVQINAGQWRVFSVTDGTSLIAAAGTATASTRHFVQLRRISGVLELRVDGSLIGSAAHTFDYSTSHPTYYGRQQNGSNPLNGRLEMWRITKGVARDTAVPTRRFPSA